MRRGFEILFLLFISITVFGKPMTYIYPGPESQNDKRYDYEWELLRNALEITKDSYGSYVMKTANIVMNGNRRDYELNKDSGIVTIILGIGTKEREKILTPIRIPLDKGLLGYRVFLINKRNKFKFDKITKLEMLRKFKVGQGLGWGDIKVWESNGFKVERGSDYEGLFNMLRLERFDFFPRGILGITEEYEDRKNTIAGLATEETILIYYPWPRYFFCSNSSEGKKLAERVKVGLIKMMENGDYDRIFKKHFENKIKKLNLKKRKFFKLDNPLLTSQTPLDNRKLWYDINELIK